MRKTIISLVVAAGLAGAAWADEVKLQKDAPDRHVVTRGDTLWGIAGKFLQDPWKWPQVWQMNKDEIKNPHLIYPGDVVVLDTSSGSPRLRLENGDGRDAAADAGRGGNGKTSRYDPRIRVTPLSGSATPSIPTSVIDSFLAKPHLVEPEEYKTAAKLSLGPDNKVILAAGDYGYATGMKGEVGDVWQAIRATKPLKDPDDPEGKAVIAYEAEYLGDVVVEAVGEVSTVRIEKSVKEINLGDKLIPTGRRQFINYVPHAPERDIRGKVISTFGSVGYADAGSLATVVVNRGSSDGLEIGHVLFSYKQGRPLPKDDKEAPTLLTPPLKSGNVFIYKVFDRIAYGLVLDSTLPIVLLDEVRTP